MISCIDCIVYSLGEGGHHLDTGNYGTSK